MDPTKPLEMFDGPLGIILALAMTAGSLAFWLVGAAVAERGPDRTRLIRWLEQGALRTQYVWLVQRGLNRLDRLLGDAGRADLSWPSPFGNRDPAPYWTGRAFDKLALLAVLYPLGSLVLCWLWFGDAGEVGHWLDLRTDAAGWQRALLALSVLMMLFSYCRSQHAAGWRSIFWIAVALSGAFAVASTGAAAVFFVAAVTVVSAITGAGAFAGTGAGAVAFAGAGAVAFAVVVAAAVTVVAAITGAGAFAGTGAGAFAGAGAVAFAVVVAAAVAHAVAHAVDSLVERAERQDRLGRFWCAFAPLALLLGYAGLVAGASLWTAQLALTLIATFVVLPLINLPFDFASLGLTRALLRRGCEGDSPSPVWLGLLDLLLAILLLILLAVALVLAAQAADALVLQFGGQTVLDPGGLLRRIAERPGDGANGWIYAMLFSTLIPSVLNACIGVTSLLSWSLPRLRLWLLAELHAAEDRQDGEGGWKGHKETRKRIVLAFTVQAAASVTLCLSALWGLFEAFTFVLPTVLPSCVQTLQWFATISSGWFGLPA